MNIQPPRLAQKILKIIAGPANIEDLLGDLDEWFYLNIREKSPFQAKIHYWMHVLSLSFSYAIRKRKQDAKSGAYSSNTLSPDMLQNYFKVAIRNLYQYKYFSILNTFGLAIGMSVSLLLISIISYVSTYDNFHQHRERIHTIISNYKNGIEDINYATAPIVLANQLENEFTGIQDAVRIIKSSNIFVRTTKANIPVSGYYVEPDFFNMFSFEIVQGKASALNFPNQVILTRSAAMKLFNSLDVVGQALELNEGNVFQISGVMNDHPKNSHLRFEMLFSYSSLPNSKLSVEDQWTNFRHQYVYVLLKEGILSTDLQAQLDKISNKQYTHSAAKVTFGHQQLEDIAMGPDLRHAIGPKWEASGFFLFGIFAALILLPACFNYTNISIARALKRAKEIGLRKTMGGVKSQIFFQFITETVVISLISLVGALLIFFFIREEFQSMMVAGSSLDLSLTWRMLSVFILFALLTGLVAGLFPAMHFAALNPIQALKNKLNAKGSSMHVRKILTIFQFALSFGFILSLVVFSRQYRYSLNFDFGFEKKNTVTVELQDVDPYQFRTAFAQLASVQSISLSSGLLGVNSSSTWIFDEHRDSTEVAQLFVDPSYITNFKLMLLAGKNFPQETGAQERYLIVNEEFLKSFKINTPAEAIGRTFTVDGNELEIIGVLKNFHFAPLQYPIEKFFFRMRPSEFMYANLHVAETDAFDLFTQMENTWKQLPTEKKFTGRYFEDELNDAYQTYNALIKIVGFLGLLAITISLLGMLGMVVYTSETRTKEVSIRKVMGATIVSITYMLSKDYLKMMCWAICFAIPVTVLLLNILLSEIQYYSISLSIWDVLLSSLILTVLGVSTITSQTYRTSIKNPADTLRLES